MILLVFFFFFSLLAWIIQVGELEVRPEQRSLRPMRPRRGDKIAIHVAIVLAGFD